MSQMEIDAQAKTIIEAPLTKSEKIRRLAQLGMRDAEIARAMGIIPQFVWNVLGPKSRRVAAPVVDDKRQPPAAPPGPIRLQLGEGGRVVIPAVFRTALEVDAGDALWMRMEDGEIRLYTPREALRRAQRLVREFVPEDVSLADELIAERRREAARE